jgi:hypothetical protein
MFFMERGFYRQEFLRSNEACNEAIEDPCAML